MSTSQKFKYTAGITVCCKFARAQMLETLSLGAVGLRLHNNEMSTGNVAGEGSAVQ